MILPNTENFALEKLTKVWVAKLQGLNCQPAIEFFLFECSVGTLSFSSNKDPSHETSNHQHTQESASHDP